MLSRTQKIQELALIRRGAHWPKIRYLCLSQAVDNSPSTSRKIIYLHLSYVSQPYIAVSYTWERSSQVPAYIPRYRVSFEEGDTSEISPAINFIVHRVFEYAICQGIFSVWIDRLCIRQNDIQDVESHLQVMHKIYAESASSVALLSMMMENDKMLRTLESLTKFPVYQNKDHIHESYLNDERKEDLLSLLEYLLKDQWFRRAWTYQERKFASHVDIAVLVQQRSHPKTGKGHIDRYFDIQYLHNGLLQLLKQCPRQLMARSSISELFIGGDLGTFTQSLIPLKSHGEDEIEPYVADHLVFLALERCGVSCVSDLLAIFANIRGCVYRLESRPLNLKCFSFSTCIPVTILVNHWHTMTSNARMSFAIRLDTTISRVMETLGHGELEIVSNIKGSANLNPIYAVEDIFVDDLGDDFVLLPFIHIEMLETNAFTKRSGCTCTAVCLCLTPRLTRHTQHVSGEETASKLRWIRLRAWMGGQEQRIAQAIEDNEAETYSLWDRTARTYPEAAWARLMPSPCRWTAA